MGPNFPIRAIGPTKRSIRPSREWDSGPTQTVCYALGVKTRKILRALLVFSNIFILPLHAAVDSWTLDASTGSFLAIIEKEGILKALGHNHALEVRASRATFMIGASSAALRLEIDSSSLEIDLPRTRREAGYDDDIPESDRAKITMVMRGPKGLDAAQHPLIVFDSEKIEPADESSGVWMVSGTLSLRGKTQNLEFPVSRSEDGEGFWAAGYVRLRPSEFGIKPFSSALGMVRVKDEALVRFRLRLKRKSV